MADPALACLPRTRRVLVVANPIAGGYRPTRIAALAAALGRRGIATEVRLTTYPREMVTIAAGLTAEIDTLVVAGGDGSVAEAVEGLVVRTPPVPALAVLASGTANVLAHELGLPKSPTRLAALVARRRLAPLHLGQAGARPFLLMASCGFDAAVVAAVSRGAKRGLGKLAFAAAALRLGRRGAAPVSFVADGVERRAAVAVVAKASRYAGRFMLTRATGATRPGLRLLTLADGRPGALLGAALGLVLGSPGRFAALADEPVETAEFPAGAPVQIDGEPAEAGPLVIRAARLAYPVIVP